MRIDPPHLRPSPFDNSAETQSWIETQRRMTFGEKLAMVFAMTEAMLESWDAEARLRYPLASNREILFRRAARNLGRDLTIRVYGWDLEQNPRTDETYLTRLLPAPSRG